MKQRVIYGALFAAITLAMVLICAQTRLIFVLACALIGGYEMWNAFRRCGYAPMRWPGALMAVGTTALIYFGQVAFIPALILCVFIAVFAQMIFTGYPSVRDVFTSMALGVYPIAPLMMIAGVCVNDTLCAAVLINGIIPTIMSDTFALFGGRRFGKHKLSPVISPNKTVEGFVCGVLAATLSGVLIHFLLVWIGVNLIPLWGVVLASLGAALTGALGDLAASAIKREAKIKDYSHLIPGHGGMMDRIDSCLFAVPFVAMIYALFV